MADQTAEDLKDPLAFAEFILKDDPHHRLYPYQRRLMELLHHTAAGGRIIMNFRPL